MNAVNETRVWFVTDVRGSSDMFGEILNVVLHRRDVAKKPDVVLLSGNLTGGELCIVGEDANGKAYARFRGEHCEFANKLLRNRWAKIVEKTLGGYVVEEAAIDTFSPASLDSQRIARLRSWLGLVKQTEAVRKRARFLVVPGPDDPHDIEAILSGVSGLEVCDNRAIEISSELTLACSSALTYPETVNVNSQPRRYLKNHYEYVAHIHNLMAGPSIKSRANWIFNLYMPPMNTTLDLCPQLDDNGAPITGANGPEMCHVGSKAVRDCIEKFKPIVSLHSFPPLDYRKQSIGNTSLIAPGTEAHAGYAVGAWLIFRGKELAACEQTREQILPDIWDEFLTASEKAMAVLYKKPIDIADLFQRPMESMVRKKPASDH